MRAHRGILAGSLIAALAAGIAHGGAAADGAARADRGVAGMVSVESAARLRAREGIGRTPEALAPISVRVEYDPATGTHGIEFVGAIAGSFDLRDVLERVDGGPMAEVEPIPVVIESRLPESHGSDLFESSPGALADSGTSLPWTWIAVAAWLIWPAVALLAWLLRRTPPAAIAAPEAHAATLDDEIAALLDRAADESIGTDLRARLELLVFRRLAAQIETPSLASSKSDPAGAPERIAETVRALRLHPETRELVRAIESWLHARDGAGRRGDALAMLREFRRRQTASSVATDLPDSPDSPDGRTAPEVQA